MISAELLAVLTVSAVLTFEVGAILTLSIFVLRETFTSRRFVYRLNSIMNDAKANEESQEKTIEKIGVIFRRLKAATMIKNVATMMEEVMFLMYGRFGPSPAKNWTVEDRTHIASLLSEMKLDPRQSGLSANLIGTVSSLRLARNSSEDKFDQGLNLLIEQIRDLESKYYKTKRMNYVFGTISFFGVLLPILGYLDVV